MTGISSKAQGKGVMRLVLTSPKEMLDRRRCIWRAAIVLQQVPAVAIQILKHCHGAIGCLTWKARERDTCGNHPVVVALEIVGLQKEEDATTSLIADKRLLARRGCSGQKQRCAR
jgi:hypothetical protein